MFTLSSLSLVYYLTLMNGSTNSMSSPMSDLTLSSLRSLGVCVSDTLSSLYYIDDEFIDEHTIESYCLIL